MMSPTHEQSTEIIDRIGAGKIHVDELLYQMEQDGWNFVKGQEAVMDMVSSGEIRYSREDSVFMPVEFVMTRGGTRRGEGDME